MGGARSVAEVRADLAKRAERAGPFPADGVQAALRRLADDVEPLLAEVEAAHRFEQQAGVEREALLGELEAVKRDRARLIAELHGAHRERDSLRGVVQAQRDEMFPVDRDDEPNAADLAQGVEWWARTCIWWSKQCRKAWAERDDLRAALAAAADAPQSEDDPDEAESKRQWADYQSGRWCGECRFEHVEDPPCCYGPSPAVLPEKEQQR